MSLYFRVYSAYKHHETFSFMMSLPAMSFRDGFCFSRKGGTGGGGWVHPKGANSMATSGLVSRSDLVGTWKAISVLFWHKWCWKQTISPCRASISSIQDPFFSYGMLAFLETYLSVSNWWVWSEVTYLLRMVEISSGSSFEPNNWTEQKLGYVYEF